MANEPAGKVSITEPSGADGQTGGAAQGNVPAVQNQEQPGLTLAQVQQLLEANMEQVQALLGQNAQQTARYLQSQLDKRDAKNAKRQQELRTQADKIAAIAAQRGITPEQAATLRSAWLESGAVLPEGDDQDDDDDLDTSQDGQQPGQGEALSEAELVTEQGRWIAEQVGLAAGDPELASIKTTGAPEEYVASILQAGIAKAVRLKAADSQQDTPPSPARIPGLAPEGGRGHTNPIANVGDIDALFEMASQQERARRSKA